MGALEWDIFRRVVLPATLPSIVVGSSVGMGITWEVVVAAEMISGGGSSMGGGERRRHRRRPGLLHLEFLHRRLVRADRRRNDQHRHRRLRLERRHKVLGGLLTPWLRPR